MANRNDITITASVRGVPGCDSLIPPPSIGIVKDCHQGSSPVAVSAYSLVNADIIAMQSSTLMCSDAAKRPVPSAYLPSQFLCFFIITWLRCYHYLLVNLVIDLRR
jgi:hypothetical protein